MADRFTLRCAVYAILLRENEVLLSRRFNTGWMDGKYSLPAGHLESDETATEAVCREAREEIGVELDANTLSLVHTMYRYHLYIDLFFTAKWSGEPQNLEPDKCDDIRWFPLDSLPENMVPSVRTGLEAMRKGSTFSEMSRNTEA